MNQNCVPAPARPHVSVLAVFGWVLSNEREKKGSKLYITSRFRLPRHLHLVSS